MLRKTLAALLVVVALLTAGAAVPGLYVNAAHANCDMGGEDC